MQSRSDGSRRYFDGTILYTHVDSEGRNLLDYVSAMERALEGARSVLVLGTAGGSLASQLSRRGVRVTTVDNVAASFDLARRWFGMPAEVQCVHADARAFLNETPDRWDAIAVDVFDGVDVPRAMLGPEVGALLAKALNPGGRLVWNVADDAWSLPVFRVVKVLRAAGLAPKRRAVLDETAGNTLVIATVKG
ncbi:fused MFS/spermidine synthase [Caulobacter sp. 1776]|uniref:spermidine synthase n=1 Tax=Caulobacter sp. 1776 TaxID=3156420 RepID=UPI003397F277